VADHRDVLQIERLDQGREIVGVPVHVVAVRRLARAAVTAAIVRDAAEAVLHEEEHLRVPHVGVQRPAVREGDDRARAPVLVVDGGSVFHSDRAHARVSFAVMTTHGGRL
jgi:hypothetical protein